jgi:hypothetical protein
MNLKKILLLSLFFVPFMKLFSQTVEFGYDANGNRLSRELVVEQLQANTVSLPDINTKSLNSTEDAKTTESEESKQDSITPEDEKIITVVYPNPTKGLIGIDITNLPENSVNELELYDLSGNEISVIKNFSYHTEIDMSGYNNGIYILRIKIGKKTSDWKVIKNQ